MKLQLWVDLALKYLDSIPHAWIALLGRFSVAAIFWISAQTKVENFELNFISGDFHLGIPHLSSSVVALFRDEYRLPFVSPEVAAISAAVSEHIFSVLLLLGLSSRFAALSLLLMVLIIQILVYPGAYPTHGVWACVLLLILARGPGTLSLDHLISKMLIAQSRPSHTKENQ